MVVLCLMAKGLKKAHLRVAQALTVLSPPLPDYTLEPRHERQIGEAAPTFPTDPDFRAIAEAWPGLSTAHRRLVRGLVDALLPD